MLDKAADFYLDFQRFSALKSDARSGDENAAATVARQFEGLFVQQMLSAMRAAARIDADQHSSYGDFYHEMYDKQLAQSIAGEDRLGVARMILRQIERIDGGVAADGAPAGQAETTAAAPVIAIGGGPAQTPPAAPAGAPVGQGNTAAPAAVRRSAAATPAAAVAGDAAVRLGRVLDDDFAEIAARGDPADPVRERQAFVTATWPAARAAADRLGVSPRLLIAQAALESGWGRHTMKFDDGRDGHNLFGIKAGDDWQGAVIRRPSLEFEQGILQPRVSAFRAYDAPEQSFADYADFILGRPRYAGALAAAGDDHAYIRAVHEAGYATDPDYADKVIGILDGEALRQALASLDHGELTHA